PPGSPAADEFQHAPAHAPMAEIGGSDSPISAPSAVAARPGGTQTTIRIAVGSQGMKVYLLFVDTRCTSTKGIACPTSTAASRADAACSRFSAEPMAAGAP